VAVGILCALEFRNEMGQPANGRVAALETHMRGLLGASPGLRSELDSLRLQDVVERFEADKKHQATHYTLILPGRDGEIGLERFEKSAEMRAKIGAAMTRALESIR
jgi:3-dehydroquinate synthetase